jgi:hypothetical protein
MFSELLVGKEFIYMVKSSFLFWEEVGLFLFNAFLLRT